MSANNPKKSESSINPCKSVIQTKEGYKMTEVGRIPSDWDLVALKDICELAKTKINPQSESENFKCIELEHLDQGTGRLLGYEMSQNLLSQKTIFKRGDVLFGKLRPYLKKYLLANFGGVCTSEIWVLRSKQNCENSYLYYLTQTDRIMDAANASTGTKMPRAEWSVVSEVSLAIPPTLTEQRAIATALSDVDALISSLDRLIVKKKAIKQGAMQELLTGKTRLAGFGNGVGYKMTEVGLIPEDWKVSTLGEAVEFLDEQRRPIKSADRESMKGIYPYYGASGIIDYVNDYLFNDELILLGEDGENILSRSVRLAFRVSGKIWVNNHAHVLKPKADYDIGFLTEFLESIDYSIYNSGTAQPKLNKATCKRIPVIEPTLTEQKAIATALSDMDSEIEDLVTKRDKYKQIKQGMMQELLTGKTRLI